MTQSLSSPPLVSVIIPTYNRRLYLLEAVDSALSQVYPSLEVIVIDDGSTDGTGQALQACPGDRVRYVWQGNQGESAARNRGIAMAKGKYVAFLDSDDLWLPQKLASQVPLLQGDPTTGMAFCRALQVDERGQLLDRPEKATDQQPGDIQLENLYFANPIAFSTTVVRRSVLRQAGGFDPTIRFGEDWDLWLRLRRDWKFAYHPEPLAMARVHSGAQSRFPAPEDVEPSLNDRLSVLRKAFDLSSEQEMKCSPLQNRAFAQQYGRAAFASFAWGCPLRGEQWLAEAVALDPGTWSCPSRLLEMLVNSGVAALDRKGSLSEEQLEAYVGETLDHWPESIQVPKRARRQVLGLLYAEAGYRSYLSQEWRRAWGLMSEALRVDPSLLRNRGLLRRCLYSAVRMAPALSRPSAQ